MDYLRGIIGIAVLLALAFLISINKRRIDWSIVWKGILVQAVFAVLVLKVPFIYDGFFYVSGGFVKLLQFTEQGTIFVFGEGLVKGPQPIGFVLAVRVLPNIIFFSALSSGLYYLGVLQFIVKGIAWVMTRTIKISGYESLSAAANIFLGQTEAPLLIKPFVARLTYSQLMCVMTGGMATIAGSVMGAYVMFLGGDDPAMQQYFAAQLLCASIMNAPAAIVISKIIVPETEKEENKNDLSVKGDNLGENLIHALSIGATEGLKLAAMVGGMLIAFLALVALVNYLLFDLIGANTGLNAVIASSTDGKFAGLSLEYIFGMAFRLIAWAIGVDWQDTMQFGSLLGSKIVINEFVAYQKLGTLNVGVGGDIAFKTKVMATYALCGFANFGSIAIQIAGLGGMAPNQSGSISRLGMRAVVGGTLACLLTAAVAGMLIPAQ